jgi:hypothetical protein
MPKFLYAILFIGLAASALPAYGNEEITAITATALDYMEAWYQGDAKQMKACLHPKLAKRSIQKGAGDKGELRRTSASDMIAYTKGGYGRGLWRKGFKIEVFILDHFEDVASVKVVAPHYYEYLHLAKLDGRWVIVNTLYEKKSPSKK